MSKQESFEDVIAGMRAEHDQILANARRWWKEETAEGKAALWHFINQPYENPLAELASRLAICAFGQLALDEYDRHTSESTPPTPPEV